MATLSDDGTMTSSAAVGVLVSLTPSSRIPPTTSASFSGRFRSTIILKIFIEISKLIIFFLEKLKN
jgi:hypothetical protein